MQFGGGSIVQLEGRHTKGHLKCWSAVNFPFSIGREWWLPSRGRLEGLETEAFESRAQVFGTRRCQALIRTIDLVLRNG